MTAVVSVTFNATSVEQLHADMLAMLGASKPLTKPMTPTPDVQPTQPAEASPEANAPAADPVPTAEVVPIAERKKPGRPKKAETVIEEALNKPEPAAAKNPEPTVEDARAVLKDIQTKIGNEEARQLNKKHGEEPLSEKKPPQWAAIIAEGKTLLAALDAE